MTVQAKLTEILKNNGHGPFLFIRSGFSRRYVGLLEWKELLRKFCEKIKDFEYYYSSSNSDLPYTASLMANDYKEYWWSASEMKSERDKFKTDATSVFSPLKVSVSEYVKELSSQKITETNKFYNEIEELKKVNVDGIITTNWDLLAESLFPEYKVFIGQEELLVSTPQNIGEIYKIHGCCSKPNSIILTKEDYEKFNEANPYLAAKLVTIFVENPVVFMGYSLYDPNIKALLSSIIKGIGTDNVKNITKNLIFVQREKSGRPYGFREAIYTLGEVDLTVTLLVTPDFNEIYKSLQVVEHKIPTRILRHCKEQIYNLVKSTEPSEQLCVVDYEDLDDSSKVDFVIGVGIRDRINPKGYQAISLLDIFQDVIKNNKDFNAHKLLTTTIASNQKATKYIPVYKYLKAQDIRSHEDYKNSKYKLEIVDTFNIKDFRSKQYQKYFSRECKKMNVRDIIDKFEINKAAVLIPFIPWKEIDVAALKEFIENNINNVDGKLSRYSTYFRKLICIYDAIVNGWYLNSD